MWCRSSIIRGIFLCICTVLCVPSFSLAQQYKVTRVIDGDTIKLSNGKIVELIGIDAPENRANDRAKKLAKRRDINIKNIIKAGKKSQKFLEKWIKGKKVTLEFDTVTKDDQGHLLAYVYVPLDSTGMVKVFVNAKMIEEGYATPLTIYPNGKYATAFRQLFREAQKKKKGLWR